MFISNGYGEDAIAAEIARLLPGEKNVAAFPLVGFGKGYELRGIEVVGASPPLPGGGVSLSRDLTGGILKLLVKQWKTLAALRPRVERGVVVGDSFPAFLARYALKKKFAFVGTAKSVYVQPYNFFERALLRNAGKIFVRDAATASALTEKRVDASFVGNPMMDEMPESQTPIPPFKGLTVAVLPGSRADAPHNLVLQAEALNVLQSIMGVKLRGIVVLPPTLEPGDFAQKLGEWDGMLFNPSQPFAGEYKQEDVSLLLVSGRLGDALQAATLVLGQAGTANEQAAGFGKPVVAFDLDFSRFFNFTSRHEGLSWYRWRQKKLLGDAVVIVKASSEAVAQKAAEILKNRSLYRRMSDDGKARMGAPGACRKIAESLLKY